MGFLDETSKLIGINDISNTYCISSTNGVVIEGYKKIYELSQTKITLLCEQNNKIDILGSNLEIKEISHRELCIIGDVKTINFS